MKALAAFLLIALLVVLGALVVSQFGLLIPKSTQERMATLATHRHETVHRSDQAKSAFEDLKPAQRRQLEELYMAAVELNNEFVEVFTLQVEDSVFSLDTGLLDPRADQAIAAHEDFAKFFNATVRPVLNQRRGTAIQPLMAARPDAISAGSEVVKFWVAEQQRRRQALKDYIENVRMPLW
jgi:hypothetical protein